MLANASSNTIEARGKNSVFFGKIRGLTPPPPAMVVSVGPAQGAISCVYSPTNSERQQLLTTHSITAHCKQLETHEQLRMYHVH